MDLYRFGVCMVLEPGRLVDKDRGLWTLRREFESRPGYHKFYPKWIHLKATFPINLLEISHEKASICPPFRGRPDLQTLV